MQNNLNNSGKKTMECSLVVEFKVESVVGYPEVGDRGRGRHPNFNNKLNKYDCILKIQNIGGYFGSFQDRGDFILIKLGGDLIERRFSTGMIVSVLWLEEILFE